ncbi:hypothetical protein [Actinomadura macrotermitis]|uniref:Uncharacterized protein n=1 Tax=Actinomadura macrotermitis TaxID=2585200 RepID=A0A7K0BX89_9ACTN|nr:hypothetical protein [Actinomadura macrotermitis]MQY05800.1 hypothetical protein [Actinomadura macrotermitis]
MPDEAWEELRAAGFLHAAREAHTKATLAVFGGLSRGDGFTDRSFGFAAYDVLASQLDRVFAAGDRLAGRVTRDDLNGSPGWRYGRYRVLLKRHEFGAVHAVRWDRDSPTKQAVARQSYAADPQLTLDVGLPSAADTPGMTTLVLAHSASEDPLELELFLGLPRLNADGGPAWWWIERLADEALGPDPRRKLVESTLPLWTDDEADVPVRLRARGAHDARTGTETA